MKLPPRAASALHWSAGSRRAVALALACAGLTLALWAIDRGVLGVQLFTYLWSPGPLANALPFITLFLLLLALCNRLLLALLWTLLLGIALYGAQHLKLKYLMQPVMLGDAMVVREMHVSTARLLGHYVSLPWVVAGVVVLVLGAVVLVWREPPFFQRRSRIRVVVLVAMLALAAGLSSGASWLAPLYDSQRLRAVAWAPLQSNLHAGLAGTLVHDNIHRAEALQEPIDRAAIDQFMALAAPPRTGMEPAIAASDARHPDIVIVQSESFADPAIFAQIDDSSKLLPNLRRAREQGLAGRMAVPTFGGGTVRTEFEVLTGIPLRAYPRIDFPYLQVARRQIPSLARVLHDAGYRTLAVHPNRANFWNRRQILAAMGFDRFLSLDDFAPDASRDGWYLSDAALTDRVIEVLSGAREPAFVMAISIETHGPFADSPVADGAARDAIAAPSQWPAAARSEYRNYAYHVHNADHELGRLWNFLEARGKPFVLVFYGDHLPGFDHVYDASTGFDDAGSNDEQTVPWLLIGSTANPRVDERTIESWMLGNEVLSAADLPLPPYYTLLDRAQRLLASPTMAGKQALIDRAVDSLARLHLEALELPVSAASAPAAPVASDLVAQPGEHP